MIVFGIHHNFFIVLPILHKICRCNGFFFSRRNVRSQKMGCVPEILRVCAHLHYVCNLVEIKNEDIYLSLLNTDKLNIFCKTK